MYNYQQGANPLTCVSSKKGGGCDIIQKPCMAAWPIPPQVSPALDIHMHLLHSRASECVTTVIFA